MKPVVRYGIAGAVGLGALVALAYAFKKPAAAAPSPGSGPKLNPSAGTPCSDAEAAAQGLDTHGLYKHDANGACVPDQGP